MTTFGPHDLEREAGQREAALFVRPLAGRLDDLGVEHHVRAGVVVDVVDEEALLHADLRRGEADAGRLVHRLVHRVDELGERAVDVGHRRGRPLEHGIAEEPDGVSRHRVIVVNRPSCQSHCVAVAQTRGGSTAVRTRPIGPARGVPDRERVGERVGSRARPRARGRRSGRAPAIARRTRGARRPSRAPRRRHRTARPARRTAGSRAPGAVRVSASATSAGRPVTSARTTSWSGCASARPAASRAGPAGEELRAAGREPVRLRRGAVTRREQLLVEVEERDERGRRRRSSGRCSTASVPIRMSASPTSRGRGVDVEHLHAREQRRQLLAHTRVTPARSTRKPRRAALVADHRPLGGAVPAQQRVARVAREHAEAAPPVEHAHRRTAGRSRSASASASVSRPAPGGSSRRSTTSVRGQPRALDVGRRARRARRPGSRAPRPSARASTTDERARRRVPRVRAARRARARSASAPPAAPRRRRRPRSPRRDRAPARARRSGRRRRRTPLRAPAATRRCAAASVSSECRNATVAPGAPQVLRERPRARPRRRPRRSSTRRPAHIAATSSRRSSKRRPPHDRPDRTGVADGTCGVLVTPVRLVGSGGTRLGADAERSTATRGPLQRHAIQSASVDDVGGRAVRTRPRAARGAARRSSGVDVVGDHPAAHAPAVQRHAHDRADAHQRRERVGNEVVEDAFDRGDVGRDPADAGHAPLDVRAPTRRGAPQLGGVRLGVLPGEARRRRCDRSGRTRRCAGRSAGAGRAAR